jgi:hypothetical protein
MMPSNLKAKTLILDIIKNKPPLCYGGILFLGDLSPMPSDNQIIPDIAFISLKYVIVKFYDKGFRMVQ